jgi:hypothetical protein
MIADRVFDRDSYISYYPNRRILKECESVDIYHCCKDSIHVQRLKGNKFCIDLDDASELDEVNTLHRFITLHDVIDFILNKQTQNI